MSDNIKNQDNAQAQPAKDGGKTVKPERTSKREQAINMRENHGREINHQVKDKREDQRPRDTLKTDKGHS